MEFFIVVFLFSGGWEGWIRKVVAGVGWRHGNHGQEGLERKINLEKKHYESVDQWIGLSAHKSLTRLTYWQNFVYVWTTEQREQWVWTGDDWCPGDFWFLIVLRWCKIYYFSKYSTYYYTSQEFTYKGSKYCLSFLLRQKSSTTSI